MLDDTSREIMDIPFLCVLLFQCVVLDNKQMDTNVIIMMMITIIIIIIIIIIMKIGDEQMETLSTGQKYHTFQHDVNEMRVLQALQSELNADKERSVEPKDKQGKTTTTEKDNSTNSTNVHPTKDVLHESKQMDTDNSIDGILHRAGNKMKESCLDGIKLEEILDIIDSTMIKRCASGGKDYGTVVITEGLVDLMNKDDLNKYFNGNIDNGHALLGHVICEELTKRWSCRPHDMYIRSKFLGFELRAADPNAHDIVLARELGYAAMMSCKVRQINATIVSMKGGELESIPLTEMRDPQRRNEPTVKGVNIRSLSYKVAESYMIRLRKSDLGDQQKLRKLAETANCNETAFINNFTYVAV
ncbi:pyrophosphate-dependent phosphofructo-1-kinase [Reticulomyxa filosa]|uniref:Pyrophosphate-dependent phosphofructo-1-kinase n=1 Tax=Reticulomyxa filosa TaxID=46433 RepID=X6LYF9_RETFI|nr:pyrophosphate-dependent phosphofructo-1-kinase [Reticulomyxa filosa]|eukprot:ETO06943.1 pyrophosphate-dependent phosphofructo-1-kinase [Reticulomyxa filosa]